MLRAPGSSLLFGSPDDLTQSNKSELTAGGFQPLSIFWMIIRDRKLTT